MVRASLLRQGAGLSRAEAADHLGITEAEVRGLDLAHRQAMRRDPVYTAMLSTVFQQALRREYCGLMVCSRMQTVP